MYWGNRGTVKDSMIMKDFKKKWDKCIKKKCKGNMKVKTHYIDKTSTGVTVQCDKCGNVIIDSYSLKGFKGNKHAVN